MHDGRATVLHVADRLNVGFEALAARYGRIRFRHLVATFEGRTDGHRDLDGHGLRTVALQVSTRRDYPRATVQLARTLRRERVDIVQTHGFEPSLVGLSAATMARTPVRIVTRHYSDITTLTAKPVHRWIDRRQALWAHRVVAVSEGVKQAMVRYEGVPADHVSVVQYGYDFDRLRPVLEQEEEVRLREAMGGVGKVLVATVGRMDWPKGHAYLLAAAPRILAEQPGVHFVFIGDGPLRADLESDVRRRGLDGAVTFLGFRRDAHRLMEAVDVVVQPTLTEGFSSVVIESLALERPVVVSDVAGSGEQVDDGETGLVVEPRQPDALAAAVVSLAADAALRRKMGMEGRRRTVERFNVERWIARTESVYDGLLVRPK